MCSEMKTRRHARVTTCILRVICHWIQWIQMLCQAKLKSKEKKKTGFFQKHWKFPFYVCCNFKKVENQTRSLMIWRRASCIWADEWVQIITTCAINIFQKQVAVPLNVLLLHQFLISCLEERNKPVTIQRQWLCSTKITRSRSAPLVSLWVYLHLFSADLSLCKIQSTVKGCWKQKTCRTVFLYSFIEQMSDCLRNKSESM